MHPARDGKERQVVNCRDSASTFWGFDSTSCAHTRGKGCRGMDSAFWLLGVYPQGRWVCLQGAGVRVYGVGDMFTRGAECAHEI